MLFLRRGLNVGSEFWFCCGCVGQVMKEVLDEVGKDFVVEVVLRYLLFQIVDMLGGGVQDIFCVLNGGGLGIVFVLDQFGI